jgi:hypothetical protein
LIATARALSMGRVVDDRLPRNVIVFSGSGEPQAADASTSTPAPVIP